jgi:gentisate 1,2-dioxygenase
MRINGGERLTTKANATSELLDIISGHGRSTIDGETVSWAKGDFLIFPAASEATHIAKADTTAYYVLDVRCWTTWALSLTRPVSG